MPLSSAVLQIAWDAADELRLNRPIGLFVGGNEGDDSDRILLRQITKTCKHLAGTWDWQVLRRERTFTSVASQTQSGMIPADFLRFVPETFWDRTTKWQIPGPLSSQDWQELVAWQQGAAIPSFTVQGDNILTYPVPAAGRTFAFEYITNAIGRTLPVAPATVGNEITRLATDADRLYWDDELLTLGIIYHYKQSEGLPYAEDFRRFETLKADRIKQDGGRRRIQMGGGKSDADRRIDQMRSAAVVIRG